MRVGFNSTLFRPMALVCLMVATVSACNIDNRNIATESSSEPPPKQSPSHAEPLAAPLAKPHQKLGVEMHYLVQHRGAGLLKQARERELMVKDGLLRVQLAYEGREADLVAVLEGLQTPIVHRFVKFQRLDIGLRSYKDLDAVISLRAVYRIEAMSSPILRNNPP
ncbi:MAG: hypothetical protein ACI89D_001729 [Bermanella sp.]|jgi:hypothetical protein